MATKNSKKAKREITRKIRDVSNIQNPIPGRVGASRTVIETGIPGLLWVRIEGSGQPFAAVNTAGVPSEYNHPVILARSRIHNELWEIVASRQMYTVPVNGNIRYHHTQHEYPAQDTVWVHADQFLPLLALPLGGLSVRINGGVVKLGSTRFVVANQTLDLSAHQPTTGAVWVLIEVSSAGTINEVVSGEVGSKELLTVANIPAATANAWELCAVRVYAGQEDIHRDHTALNDIIDLRFGRSGGGSSLVEFLDDLADVNAPSPTDLQVLTYDVYAGEWIAADPTSADPADIHGGDATSFP